MDSIHNLSKLVHLFWKDHAVNGVAQLSNLVEQALRGIDKVDDLPLAIQVFESGDFLAVLHANTYIWIKRFGKQ